MKRHVDISIAFLCAALTAPILFLAASALAGGFNGTAFFATLVAIYATLSVLLIGVPSYVIVRRLLPINIYLCAVGGFLAGAVPFGFFVWPYGGSTHNSLEMASDGQWISTMLNGVPTAVGWFNYLRAVAFMGLCGLVSGLVFWAVHKRALGPNHSLKADHPDGRRP